MLALIQGLFSSWILDGVSVSRLRRRKEDTPARIGSFFYFEAPRVKGNS